MNMEQGYNEDNAVMFIRKFIPDEITNKYSDDEILCVVDIIWDYYEERGLLSLNDLDAEDELLNIDDLLSYVKREVKNNPQLSIDPNDIPYIVKGELEYEESLDDIL